MILKCDVQYETVYQSVSEDICETELVNECKTVYHDQEEYTQVPSQVCKQIDKQ